MCTGPQCEESGPNRDSPLGYLIASGIFVATYRAVPVTCYLGASVARLKGVGDGFEPLGEPVGAFDQ